MDWSGYVDTLLPMPAVAALPAMLAVAALPAMPDALALLASLLAMLVAPLLAAGLTLAFYWRWSPSRLSSGGVASLGDVVMMPLETDLTEASTFVTLPAATPQSAPRSAFPTYMPPSQPATPAIPPAIPPLIPPLGSSLAVLDSPLYDEPDDPEPDGATDDPDWPPTPRTPGAKTYRYVLASGELVRLRSLHRIEVYPLPSWAYN